MSEENNLSKDIRYLDFLIDEVLNAQTYGECMELTHKLERTIERITNSKRELDG